MKNAGVFLVAMAGFLILPDALSAQTATFFSSGFPRFNPPPCDFADNFYTVNGFDVTNLDTAGAGRFGNFRQTGPPAFLGGQLNWVNDNDCSADDPVRRNVRILATTGAYKDDDGAPTQFFSLIAFLLNQNFFTNGANATPNVRGFTTQQIVANFEAYGALTQRVNGFVLAPTPCGSLHDVVSNSTGTPALAANPCFPVTSVATPQLRHDWRIASNRNAIDGSSNGPNTPFGYFCDDLTGSWIVTYFWYTQFAVGGTTTTAVRIFPTATCNSVLAAAGKQNGFSLDGTPIIHTGDELHFLEGVASNPQFGLPLSAQPPLTAPCGAEGNLDVGGADGGAVWLICPTILDPRNGAIAQDSFLDVVRRPRGGSLDPRFAANFACLKQTGQFPVNGVCQGSTTATASSVP